jgi:hypothetical protein
MWGPDFGRSPANRTQSFICPAPPCPAVPPAGRALDAAEHLLVKCRPLSHQWGCERFGLADPSVLQAIEVQRGVREWDGMGWQHCLCCCGCWAACFHSRGCGIRQATPPSLALVHC